MTSAQTLHCNVSTIAYFTTNNWPFISAVSQIGWTRRFVPTSCLFTFFTNNWSLVTIMWASERAVPWGRCSLRPDSYVISTLPFGQSIPIPDAFWTRTEELQFRTSSNENPIDVAFSLRWNKHLKSLYPESSFGQGLDSLWKRHLFGCFISFNIE